MERETKAVAKYRAATVQARTGLRGYATPGPSQPSQNDGARAEFHIIPIPESDSSSEGSEGCSEGSESRSKGSESRSESSKKSSGESSGESGSEGGEGSESIA